MSQVENRATNLEKLSKTRRDIWPSKPAALEWMKMRKGFQSWHPKVLEIYAVRIRHFRHSAE
jgi:hypothetical protein